MYLFNSLIFKYNNFNAFLGKYDVFIEPFIKKEQQDRLGEPKKKKKGRNSYKRAKKRGMLQAQDSYKHNIVLNNIRKPYFFC